MLKKCPWEFEESLFVLLDKNNPPHTWISRSFYGLIYFETRGDGEGK